MHGLLRCNINTSVHARARGAGVSLRDVTIARDGKRGYRVRMTSHTGSVRRIWGIWRKLVELRLDTGREGSTFAWAGVARDAGGRWKGQNRKMVPLSPYVEKPLNSKVIKSFVPELRNRYVFFEFRDSYVLSLWTFDVHFTHGRIWLWYTKSWYRYWQCFLNLNQYCKFILIGSLENSNVGDHSRGQQKGSLFNSYYTEV